MNKILLRVLAFFLALVGFMYGEMGLRLTILAGALMFYEYEESREEHAFYAKINFESISSTLKKIMQMQELVIEKMSVMLSGMGVIDVEPKKTRRTRKTKDVE